MSSPPMPRRLVAHATSSFARAESSFINDGVPPKLVAALIESHMADPLGVNPEGEAPPLCKHKGRCVPNAVRGALRAMAYGFLIKGSLRFIMALLLRGALMRPSKWFAAIRSSYGLDSVRFALFVGSLVGVYKGSLCSLRAVRKVEDGWNATVAGALSGMCMALDGDKARRTEVSLYALARALSMLWSYLVHAGWLPEVPYGDSLLFGLVCMLVQYAFFFEPETMRPSYYRFLRIFGQHKTLDTTVEFYRNARFTPPGEPGVMTLGRLFSEIRW